jgi:L-ribulose-5-phosphate 3-epimerase UlaE
VNKAKAKAKAKTKAKAAKAKAKAKAKAVLVQFRVVSCQLSVRRRFPAGMTDRKARAKATAGSSLRSE